METKTTSVWIPQVLFESALIVVSILVALGLDEWREKDQDQEVIEKSLSNFVSEISQNKARVDDAAPFNQGLRNVLNSHYLNDDIESVDEFVNMVESYSSAGLHSTAWETALATGSLAKMEYNLVTALSLTYRLQNRYQLATRSGMKDLTSPQNLSDSNLRLAIYNSIRYLDDVIGMEAELGVIYEEADSIIRSALVDMGIDVTLSQLPMTAEAQQP